LAVGYVRPHDVTIELEGTDTEAVKAKTIHIHVVGRIVQVELKHQDDDQFSRSGIDEREIPGA